MSVVEIVFDRYCHGLRFTRMPEEYNLGLHEYKIWTLFLDGTINC